MADENIDTGPTEVEQRARRMGWRPQEEFTGDEGQFVDAATFIKRGEEVLPIVNATNKRLRERVDTQEARLLELERTNRANAAALEAIQTTNQEHVVERAEQTIDQIEAGIITARENNDMQAELTLLRQHAEAVTKLGKAKEKPTTIATHTAAGNGGADPAQTPEFRQFLSDNPWWSSDSVMRAASIEIQNQLVREGKIPSGMSQADRLELVGEATRAKFGMKDNGRRGGHNRVEGGGGPGSGGTTNSSSQPYSSLPDAAKEACTKAARHLKIGKGEKFATVEDWQKEYTRIYYAS